MDEPRKETNEEKVDPIVPMYKYRWERFSSQCCYPDKPEFSYYDNNIKHPAINSNIREEYAKLTRKTSFDVMMREYLPVWRRLSGLPEKKTLLAELHAVRLQLKSMMYQTGLLKDKIEEILKGNE